MTPLHNRFILDIPTPKLEGFFFDTRFEPLRNAPKKGTVRFVPRSVTDYIYDVPILIGDTVHHHHLATQPSFEIKYKGETLYWQEYNQLFAIEREGKFIPLEKYVFIEPIAETVEDIKVNDIFLKNKLGKVTQTGVIRYLSNYASHYFTVGDKVMYFKRAQYELDFQGQTLFKTRIDNLHFTCD